MEPSAPNPIASHAFVVAGNVQEHGMGVQNAAWSNQTAVDAFTSSSRTNWTSGRTVSVEKSNRHPAVEKSSGSGLDPPNLSPCLYAARAEAGLWW